MANLSLDTYSDSWSDTGVDMKLRSNDSSSSMTERTLRINQLEKSIDEFETSLKEMTDSLNHLKDLENTNNNNNVINVNVNTHDDSSSSSDENTGCWSCARLLPRCILALI